MKILAVADEECAALWDYCDPKKIKEYDLILSCGDLRSDYLSFLVTMARCPLLYVHGNHDASYQKKPPEGCDCIDDRMVVYNGIRILGLGGSIRYRPGPHQYTDREMRRRIHKLRLQLLLHGGVDIVVTHSPPRGLGDSDDPAHRGFQSLVALLDRYHPQYLLHGHVHMNYDYTLERVREYNGTQLVNAYRRHVISLPDRDIPPEKRNRLFWAGLHHPDNYIHF